MRVARYFVAFIVPAAVLASLLADGGWTFIAPVVLFGLLPLVELVHQGTTDNLSPDEERTIARQRRYDWLLYSMVPIQFALLGVFLWRVVGTSPSWLELGGLTLSMGMACGVLGINVAHELGHRRKRSEQRMAKALLTTSLYCHFFIEHNRGHHARVATHDDPATSRYGESLYAFIPRSMVMGYLGAWQLENERMAKRGKAWWKWENEMVRMTVWQLALIAAIGLALGPMAAAAFVVAAGIGGMLLETVNYIEHYGLTRQAKDGGGYERVLPIHSWNSNHPIGRAALFELTRHSDHHANARRPYPILRHFDESPQFPTGYPGMMTLAWFPPLWFAVMHRHIQRHREQLADATPVTQRGAASSTRGDAPATVGNSPVAA